MGDILVSGEWLAASPARNQRVEPVHRGCEVCGTLGSSRTSWYSVRTRRFRCRGCFDAHKGLLLRRPKRGQWNDGLRTLVDEIDAHFDDVELFRVAVSLIQQSPVWTEKYGLIPEDVVKAIEGKWTISAVVRNDGVRNQWWPYVVDREHLRRFGPGDIEKDFLIRYDSMRNARQA